MPYGNESKDFFVVVVDFHAYTSSAFFLLGKFWPCFSKTLTHDQLQGETGPPGLPPK